MAVLYRLPVFLSLTAQEFSNRPTHLQWSCKWSIHGCQSQSRFTIYAASSVNRPRSRASRKVKSNEELCKEIRELVSEVGLPEGHVPTMKEFSLHGRNDLANIVRRRGYKIVRELLANSTKLDHHQPSADEKLTATSDSLTDNVYSMLSEHTEESEELVERQDELGIQSRTDEEPFRHDCSSMMNAGLMLNGSIFQPKDVTSIATLTDSHRDDYPKAEDAGVDKDLNVETIRRENQIEINHLKFLLHQKELELTKLKEQIEKEKLALSDLQTKAETEINKAQKLISEKDAELHAAEESLSGLKEVEIQYCGDGETVEVAGSFNGWYHRIKLDPQTSSITESIGSR